MRVVSQEVTPDPLCFSGGSILCLYSLHVGSINSKPNLHWCGGEESLELEKARGDLLGERAMAEAVG